jgi:hypothetical protein
MSKAHPDALALTTATEPDSEDDIFADAGVDYVPRTRPLSPAPLGAMQGPALGPMQGPSLGPRPAQRSSNRGPKYANNPSDSEDDMIDFDEEKVNAKRKASGETEYSLYQAGGAAMGMLVGLAAEDEEESMFTTAEAAADDDGDDSKKKKKNKGPAPGSEAEARKFQRKADRALDREWDAISDIIDKK